MLKKTHIATDLDIPQVDTRISKEITMKESANPKLLHLKRTLHDLGSVAIGFSGGVDSTFLAAVAFSALGQNAVAFTALSGSFPAREKKESASLAARIGIRQVFFESEEVDIPEFKTNPTNRCYYCKLELYSKLKQLAEKEGLRDVIDASNADDAGDFRPGLQALNELGIRSPLMEAGLTKQEIRRLSRQMALPTWDKPSFACLSSRFQYGDAITLEKLERVEQAEDLLQEMGFRILRARDHGSTVRLEVGEGEIIRFFDPELRSAIVKELKKIGYSFISLDLEGYRTGSMNQVNQVVPQR